MSMDTSVLVAKVKQCLPDRSRIEHHEPFIHKNKTIEYLAKCVDYGVTSHTYVDQFEAWLKNRTKAQYCLCTNTGTAALHLALMAAGVKIGDEVICPTTTFVATANAITHAGGVPHFIDAAPHIDPQHLKEYLSKNCIIGKERTLSKKSLAHIAAIVVVHLFGLPADIKGICEVAKEFNLIVIEDASQALGTYVDNQHVGTFGWAGTFSFNNNKVLTTNGGGALITNSGNIHYEAKQLATTARKPHPWLIEHESLAWNYRMGNINAALGMAQTVDFDKTLAAKRALAVRYRHKLGELLEAPIASDPNYWLNVVLVDERDRVLEALHAAGIRARASFTPLHTLPFYKYSMGGLYNYVYNICDDDMHGAVEFFNKAVCLPSGGGL